ncbi:hypothetical protein QYF36_012284 [Acer negundo]|nr:hypothetical protein QYF36_012284 [Acer negundo]
MVKVLKTKKMIMQDTVEPVESSHFSVECIKQQQLIFRWKNQTSLILSTSAFRWSANVARHVSTEMVTWP